MVDQGKYDPALKGYYLPEGFKPPPRMQVSYDAAANMTLVTLNVRVTRHGPVLNDVVKSLRNSPDAVAMKWTAIQPGASVVPAVLGLDRRQRDVVPQRCVFQRKEDAFAGHGVAAVDSVLGRWVSSRRSDWEALNRPAFGVRMLADDRAAPHVAA